MEFAGHAGEQVLEIGGGIGTDLAQFARNGAIVTDVDLSAGHCSWRRRISALRGLTGRFVHHDAESLPFDDNAFDLVLLATASFITRRTPRTVAEIYRVLKPGGRAIVMVYAENSLQYWRKLVWHYGMKSGDLASRSMAEIMSRTVERTGNDARPLVKVYTKPRLRALFDVRRHSHRAAPNLAGAGPSAAARLLPIVERMVGWNLIIKAAKAARVIRERASRSALEAATPAAAGARSLPPPRRWSEELAEAGVKPPTGWSRCQSRAACMSTSRDAAMDRLRVRHPGPRQGDPGAAERVLRHEFDLLGSGPYEPVDPDREADRAAIVRSTGISIRCRRLRFPRGVPLAEWDLDRMRPGGADIKLPWELARCQHWPLLGQAFRFTGDERFALEIARRARDFMAANPVGTASTGCARWMSRCAR